MGPPCNRRGAEETSAGDEEKVMKVIMIVKIMMKRMLCGLVMPQDGRLEVLHEGKRKMATKMLMMMILSSVVQPDSRQCPLIHDTQDRSLLLWIMNMMITLILASSLSPTLSSPIIMMPTSTEEEEEEVELCRD